MDWRKVAFGLGVGTCLVGFTQKPTGKLTVGPVSYFENNCARCHGQHGDQYDLKALAKLTDVRLRQYVKEMAAGPGNAPLAGPDLEAQVAYHRSLIKKKPFVAILEWSGGKAKGEAWGTDAIWSITGSKRGKVMVKDSTFVVAGAAIAVTAKGKAEVVLGKDWFNNGLRP